MGALFALMASLLLLLRRSVSEHLAVLESQLLHEVGAELLRTQLGGASVHLMRRREFRLLHVALPLLRLEDQHTTFVQQTVYLTEERFNALIAPVKVDPLGDAQAQDYVVLLVMLTLVLDDVLRLVGD